MSKYVQNKKGIFDVFDVFALRVNIPQVPSLHDWTLAQPLAASASQQWRAF
jgi:hypothetical protein